MYNSNTDSLRLILDVEVFFSLGHCSGALCNPFFFCLYVSATILFHPQNVSFKINVLYIITITLCYCVQFNACYQNQFKIHTSVFLTRLDTASGVLQCIYPPGSMSLQSHYTSGLCQNIGSHSNHLNMIMIMIMIMKCTCG